MTEAQFRKSAEFLECYEKVKNYPKGFRFTVPLSGISQAKLNALAILLGQCQSDGLIKSVSIGLSINGKYMEETYERL